MHRWIAADGQPIVILNSSTKEPSVEERQRIETTLRNTRLSLGKIKDLLTTKDLQLKTFDSASLRRSIEDARATLRRSDIEREMHDLQKQLQSGELARRLRDAERVQTGVKDKDPQ